MGHSSWEVSNLHRNDECSNDCGKRAVRQAHHTLCTGICGYTACGVSFASGVSTVGWV